MATKKSQHSRKPAERTEDRSSNTAGQIERGIVTGAVVLGTMGLMGAMFRR